VTDGQTDGQTVEIAVASTALAMRALRRAVKMEYIAQELLRNHSTTLKLPISFFKRSQSIQMSISPNGVVATFAAAYTKRVGDVII